MSSVVEKYAPTVAEQSAAVAVGEALSQDALGPRLVTASNQIVEIPHGLATLFESVAKAAAQGQLISVRLGGDQLSPREAAEELGVSRTHLCKLMDEGEIAFERVGSHRRVEFEELRRYRSVRAQQIATRYREATAGLPDAPDEPMPDGPRLTGRRPRRT